MQTIGRLLAGAGIAAAVMLAAPVARAEVVASSDAGFVVRLAREVTAPPAEAWKTILTPAQWWQSQHTFSGEAANLSLDSQIGGCFCEVLPRPEGAPATQKPGGVQHMRVIYIEPPRALRLSGALGPLQSEALAATLTITVKPTETAAGSGSRILFEYVVGGFMRYKADDIAAAVDRMLAAQLTSLAGKLGPVAAPAGGAVAGPPAPDGELPASGPASTVIAPLNGAESYRLPPKGGAAAEQPAPRSVPAPAVTAEPKPETKADAKAEGAVPAPAKPVAKAAAKPAAKAADPEAEARREANALFDAALAAPTTP